MTAGHWEEALQVNGLATGLLGVLLLPLLAQAAATAAGPGSRPFKPHLAVVGSVAHEWVACTRPDPATTTLLADLNHPASPNTTKRYNLTKLVSLFLARRLAHLPAAAGVVVNAVNPGLCRTDIFRDAPGWLTRLGFVFSWSAEDGAKNIAWACVTDTPAGAYIEGTAVGQASAFAASEDGLALERDL